MILLDLLFSLVQEHLLAVQCYSMKGLDIMSLTEESIVKDLVLVTKNSHSGQQ